MDFLFGCRLCTNKIFYVYGPKLISEMILEPKFARLNQYLRKGVCLMCYKFIFEIYQTKQLYENRLRISSIYNVHLSEESESCCRTCGKPEPMQDTFMKHNCSMEILQSVFSDLPVFETQKMFVLCEMCTNLIKILHEFALLCTDVEYMLGVYTVEWIVVLKTHQKWKELLQYSYRLVKTDISNNRMQENSVFITLRDLDEFFDENNAEHTRSNDIISVEDDNALANQDSVIDLTFNNTENEIDQNEEMMLIINDANDAVELSDEDSDKYTDEANMQHESIKSESICEVFDEVLMTVDEYEKWDNSSDISDSPFMGYVDEDNTNIANMISETNMWDRYPATNSEY